jgi:hypothetical protein
MMARTALRGPSKTVTSLCEVFPDQLVSSGEHKKLEYEIEEVADQAVWVSTLMLGTPNDCAVLYYVEENGFEYETRDFGSLLKEKAGEVWPLLTVRPRLVVRKLKLPYRECKPEFTTKDNGDIYEIPARTIPFPSPPQER